jgi:hypothetical protein
MAELKNNSLTDRLAAAAAAKKAQLEKFRPKPQVSDPNFVSSAEVREAERKAIREERQKVRDAARETAAAEKAHKAAKSEVDRKAARDAKYAARRARR